jgi:hypothetical protein
MTLQHPRWTIAPRPALVGLAVVSATVGAFAVVRAAENVWAADAERNLEAARGLANGSFGTVVDYLYSPLAAALTMPALAVPTDVAVLAWLAFELFLLVVVTAVATRSRELPERLLAGVAVICFLPILYDLELGNVTVVVAASVALVAWTPDRVATGIPLGLVLATAPKPQLIPVLIWLAVFHRRALAGAIGTAALATLAGVAFAGSAAYATWVDVLRAPRYLGGERVINLALWSLPLPLALGGSVAAVGAFVVAVRRGYWPGLIAAICVGLLLAPYTLIYAAGVLLVGVPAAVRAVPRAVLALAITAPIALVVAFPLWVGAVLALAALVPADRWPSSLDPEPAAPAFVPAEAPPALGNQAQRP